MLSLTSLVVKRHNSLARMIALALVVAVLVGTMSQTAFAQNTYVITDGDQVTVHTSFASDPEQVLEEAGFRLDADDFYITQPTEGGSEITVQRAQSITVRYCGEEIALSSYGESLQSLFARNGLYVDDDHRVSISVDSQTYDGMQVTVDRVVRRTEAYTEQIPYETSYLYDPSMPEGETRLLTEGQPGVMAGSASVVYVNNNEQSRIIIEEKVETAPVRELIAVGTGELDDSQEAMPLIGDGIIILPTGEQLLYSSSSQFVASAYNKNDAGCDDITATGTFVRKGVVAVDPRVIPYGTKMFIITNDGEYVYGISYAEDCGGSIKGNRVDLYFDTVDMCWEFGMRDCTIYFLETEE